MSEESAATLVAKASDNFSSRARWVDFVNMAATVPSFDFQNQLVLAHQAEKRQATVTTLASRDVWSRFGYKVRPGVEPFLIRSVATQDPGKGSITLKAFGRGQVEGRGDGVPRGLSPAYMAKASSEGLADRLTEFARGRGLSVVETDPAYLPNQVASLVHSRAEGVTRLLLRKDATELQRCRGLVGTLTADILGRFSRGRDMNPFVATGVRHIVSTANGLTDRRYEGAPKAAWPTQVDANTAYRWGEVTSMMANAFLAATSLEPQRLLSPTANLWLTDDLTREAARHIRLEVLAEKKQTTAMDAGSSGLVADTSLIDSISGGEASIAEVVASSSRSTAEKAGSGQWVAVEPAADQAVEL